MNTRMLERSARLAVSALVVAACATSEPEVIATPPASQQPSSTEANGATPVPVSEWKFESDGATSTGGVDLQLNGAYQLSDGGISFDGYTGYASSDAPGPLDTTSSFSVSAWVNYASESDIAVAVGQLGEVTSIFGLGVGENRQWMFGMKKEDVTGLEYSVIASGPPTTPSDRWVHLTGVSDQEEGVIRLFVDGEQEAEASFAAPLAAAGPLTIGRGQFDARPANFWPGGIGAVAVFQTALNSDQIRAIYQETGPDSPPPAIPVPDPASYADGVLDGTWDYAVPDGDFKTFLTSEFGVPATNDVVIRLGFDGHRWWQGVLFDDELFLVNGLPEGDGGVFLTDGDLMVTTSTASARVSFEWKLDEEELALTVVEECWISAEDITCITDRAQMDPVMIEVMEHSYSKSGNDPSY